MSNATILNYQPDDRLEESNVYGTRHGSAEFPLAVYENYRSCDEGDVVLDVHWHNECEILLVTSGEVNVIIDNTSYRLNSGQTVFVGSHQLHSCFSLCDRECSYTSIVFDMSLLMNSKYDIDQTLYLAPLIRGDVILPTKPAEKLQSIICEQVESIAKIYKYKKGVYTLQIKGYLYLIFSMLFEGASQPSNITRKQMQSIEQIKIVLNYIDEQINEPLSTDTLSKVIFLSNEHFCRLFKKTTGRTPVDYINNRKMNKAAELLQEGDKKVIEIAFSLGYNNLSHFNRLFKRYMKKLPKEYKPR